MKHSGFINDITPTTIKVDAKVIYIPPEKREMLKTFDPKLGQSVKIVYEKGNLQEIERLSETEAKKLPRQQVAMGSGGGERHTQFEPEHPPEPKTSETKTVVGETGTKSSDVHIHKEIAPKPAPSSASPAAEWISEREKHETILLQSVLARAVEIVNAQYHDQETVYKDKTFREVLDIRCEHIEHVSKRLKKFVKTELSEKP